MQINRLESLEQYLQYLDEFKQELTKRRAIETKISKQVEKKKQLEINGISWPIQQKSSFIVDKLYSNQGEINFRERLVCNKTKLNNRTRASLHAFESEFKPKLTDTIYITEQCSSFAKWMFKKYKHSVGSEYLDNCSWYYKTRLKLKLFPIRLNHQDLTKLSYKREQFKYLLSFDCLEHIPDYYKALTEIYRTLTKDGNLILSVPFDINNPNNLIRAKINKTGNIDHFVEPEYHGDPVSGTGCLSFYTFGWELLEELKKIGFKKTYINLIWSKKYAYLGPEQILICAEK
jgi:SAM-dependent methyltransferase